jgi:predicted dienelactone hydrolase
VVVSWVAGQSASATQLRGQRRGAAAERRAPRNPGETHQIAGLRVSLWKPSSGSPAPLVVFSHGFHGCGTQSTFLTDALARAGYLIVAPNHKDASCDAQGRGGAGAEEPFRDPEAWSAETYKDRADDVTRLVAALREDPAWSRQIDWSRVGLAGHSLGGYTVLGLAGGWPAWKLAPVKAVLALSPYCMPFVVKGNLEGARIPIMYQGGTRDLGITPAAKNRCFRETSSPAYFVEFTGAGHFAWTDLTDSRHELIEHYSIAFFDKHLKGSATADPARKRTGVRDLKVK